MNLSSLNEDQANDQIERWTALNDPIVPNLNRLAELGYLGKEVRL